MYNEIGRLKGNDGKDELWSNNKIRVGLVVLIYIMDIKYIRF